MTKIQRGNVGYWLAAVAQGGEDYYTKPGEAPGEWLGDLADELDLAGQVDEAGYTAILEGRDPTTGAELIARPATRVVERADGSQKRLEPVLGYDVRFSAPKSVSLLYSLSDEPTRERIVVVLNDAVRQGIRHLEREACMVRRGRGGHRIEAGQGFVGMAFRHRMSRAGDPALHVHVVVSNLTRAAADGKWLSLASPKGRSPLFPHGKSAGVVFQAALRAGFLREFGLEFEAVTNGYADLKGFSRELVEAFSTRSREIATWLEQHGVSSAAAAQTAAYRTRDAKDYGVDHDQRVEEWEAQAEPFGFGKDRARQIAAEGQPRQPALITDAQLQNAVRQLEGSSSHFDRRQLLWAVADQLPEGADLDHLTNAVDRLLASELVLRIHESTDPLDPTVYTTPRVAAAERSFIEGALRGVGAGVGVADSASIDSALARHPYLGEDQREMVIRLASGGEQVVTVAAWPGTGKTTALRAAAEAWAEAGFPVIGCATARSATGELIDAGVRPSFSIASLLYRAETWNGEGRKLAPGTIIVVDEANVSSTFDLEALRALVVECEGKLVLIGDPKQIGAIGPGGLFVHADRVLDSIPLTTIRRQQREADQRIVTLVHEGRGSEALDLLRAEGKMIVGDDLPSTLHGLLIDWYRDYASGADAVMIARRNDDVRYLNEQARELRRDQGELGSAEVLVGETPIASGDRVLTRINSREVDNRERWDVLGVDPAARTVALRRVGGDEREVVLGPSYLDDTTKDGSPALQHAYAITKFGAESKTFDRAYPLLDPGASLEQELVAVSRGREIANVYAVAADELLDPDLGPARRELVDALQDVRATIERENADQPATSVPIRQRVEELTNRELAERRAQLEEQAIAFDPVLERHRGLQESIAKDHDLIEQVAHERQALEKLPHPPRDELSRLAAVEANTAHRLEMNSAERDSLPHPATGTSPPRAPQDRLEAALIENRIARLASREITAARSGESRIIFQALGPYPEDPAKAAAWADAAHAIVTYRLRHDVRDQDHPLGREPQGAPVRMERAAAEQRLNASLRELGREPQRELERSISRDIGIGL